MKQIVFIFMAILLATGMASAQKKAVISAETTSFDFGTIKEAGRLKRSEGQGQWRRFLHPSLLLSRKGLSRLHRKPKALHQ